MVSLLMLGWEFCSVFEITHRTDKKHLCPTNICNGGKNLFCKQIIALCDLIVSFGQSSNVAIATVQL